MNFSSLSLPLSLNAGLIHCVHKWFILCVGCLQVAWLLPVWMKQHPSMWSALLRVLSCSSPCFPMEHRLTHSLLLPRSQSPLTAGSLSLSLSPCFFCGCLSLSENLLIREDCSNAASAKPPLLCSIAQSGFFKEAGAASPVDHHGNSLQMFHSSFDSRCIIWLTAISS